jgi:hypothetical protein
VRPESPPPESPPLDPEDEADPPPLDPEDDADPPALYPEDETDPPPEDVDPVVLLVAAPEEEIARGSDSRWRTRVYPTPSIAWPAPFGGGLSGRPPSTTAYEEPNAYG